MWVRHSRKTSSKKTKQNKKQKLEREKKKGRKRRRRKEEDGIKKIKNKIKDTSPLAFVSVITVIFTFISERLKVLSAKETVELMLDHMTSTDNVNRLPLQKGDAAFFFFFFFWFLFFLFFLFLFFFTSLLFFVFFFFLHAQDKETDVLMYREDV